MQALSIDPPIPYVLPAGPLTIVQVGCGGTGSFLAQSLSRLASHCRDTGLDIPHLIFVDGDTVEQKNVGRQLFAPAEVGRNKAQALAARFSLALGLKIQAIPRMYDGRMQIADLKPPMLMVGAVDNAAARRAIADTVRGMAVLWLDCGNHEHAGQVVIGHTLEREQYAGCIRFGGLCAALPGPALVSPELLQDAPPIPRADCAAAVEDNVQSLMVNSQVATIAAQYLSNLVIHRRITRFETIVDLQAMSMRSTPITARTIAAATGLTVEQVTGAAEERKAA